jgi:sulfur transfer complex TusBCD TusB component (DsrH family)
MRKLSILLIIFISSLMLFGCATLKTNKTGVCDDPLVLEQSNLCQIAKDRDMQIEDFQDILIDAELISFISEGLDPADVVDWCQDALVYLNSLEEMTTYEDIFYMLEKDMKARILFRIISRRVGVFKIPEIVTNVDKGFLIAAVNELRAQAEFYKEMG